MLQDPLSAIGARLEARLIAQDSRIKSVEQTVKENVAANRPAVFTMLPDGTKQFGYAPTSVDVLERPSETAAVDDTDYGIGIVFSSSVRDEIKAQFIANAPVLKSASELETAAAPVEAVDLAAARPEQIAVNQAFPSAAQADSPVTVPAPVVSSAPDAAPVVMAAPSAPVLPATASPVAVEATASNSAHVTNSVAANVAASVNANVTSAAPSFIVLPDGTKQFGFAPTGSTTLNRPRAEMPAVTPAFGAGATFRLNGINQGPTMSVTRTGDGLVFANVTDGDGTREMAFVPSQLSLVTPATV